MQEPEEQPKSESYSSMFPTDRQLTFSGALMLMRSGQLLQREGWNGKGMFVFMQNGSEIPHEMLRHVQGLPKPVVDMLIKQGKNFVSLPFITMYTAAGQFVTGWLASQTDMLADDWQIVELK